MTASRAVASQPMPEPGLQLLRAALLPVDEALVAWRQWQARQSIESAGPGEQPLFGMVYANLGHERHGSHAALLKGVYKRNLYANQMAFAQARPLLDRLTEQGSRPLLLNDAALVAAYFPDPGWRAMRCIDILLPGDQAGAGGEAAGADGWRARPQASFGGAGMRSADLYTADGRRSLRIWTNLFTAEPQQETEALTFRHARTVEREDSHPGRPAIAVAGPVETLLGIAAEAFRSGEVPLHAYADALRLLGHFDAEADWTRLVWQAQRYEHVLPLRNLLAGVESVAPATVPDWVLPSLRRMAIAYSELLQFHRACDTRGLRVKSAGLRWFRRLRPEVRGA